jgi:hypothetical protein
VCDINPPRGNKRPNKSECLAAGGKFSSRTVHNLLTNMNTKYEEFFAEEDSSEENDSDPDNEGL